MIEAAFLEEGIDFLCHGAMTPSGRAAKQLRVIMLEGWGGTQPYLGTGEGECRGALGHCGCDVASVAVS